MPILLSAVSFLEQLCCPTQKILDRVFAGSIIDYVAPQQIYYRACLVQRIRNTETRVFVFLVLSFTPLIIY
jgi:hypothetical protein